MMQRAIKIQIRVHPNPSFLPSRTWNSGRYVVPAYRIFYKEKSKSTKLTWSKSRLIAISASRANPNQDNKTAARRPEASEAENELSPTPKILSIITMRRIHPMRKIMSNPVPDEMNSTVILTWQSRTLEREEERKAANWSQNRREEVEVVLLWIPIESNYRQYKRFPGEKEEGLQKSDLTENLVLSR